VVVSIPGFDIMGTLGQGQSAAVYEARDTRHGRVVALKVLKPELLAHEAARLHFHREARALLRVVHPNVVAVFDYSGPDAEQPWIASERLQGQPLKALVDERGVLPESVCAALFQQVLWGLEAAHAYGLLHRDLSLSNIFVEETGRAVVTDFGLAASV